VFSASLTVKDLERSVRWYTDAIGFIVTQRHERAGRLVAVSLKAGTAAIVLGQDDGAKGWERARGEGITLQFETGQNVDALAARVTAYGWPLLSEPDAAWGPRALRVADPDGYRLVFSGLRDAST
jgi:catechol 2,3-dioxygenase-like lactoylglutathione lyase family enzyme